MKLPRTLLPGDRLYYSKTEHATAGAMSLASNLTDHQAPASGALVHPVVGQTESQEAK